MTNIFSFWFDSFRVRFDLVPVKSKFLSIKPKYILSTFCVHTYFIDFSFLS
jgi:hypothetical protein